MQVPNRYFRNGGLLEKLVSVNYLHNTSLRPGDICVSSIHDLVSDRQQVTGYDNIDMFSQKINVQHSSIKIESEYFLFKEGHCNLISGSNHTIDALADYISFTKYANNVNQYFFHYSWEAVPPHANCYRDTSREWYNTWRFSIHFTSRSFSDCCIKSRTVCECILLWHV